MATGSISHGHAESEALVTDIVTAVADAEGVGPMDLPPLYDSIDPESLVTFVEEGDQTASTSFQYCGWQVSVSGDGIVRLHRPP